MYIGLEFCKTHSFKQPPSLKASRGVSLKIVRVRKMISGLQRWCVCLNLWTQRKISFKATGTTDFLENYKT